MKKSLQPPKTKFMRRSKIEKGRRGNDARLQCCCCLPTPPCLLGGVLPYFEVTGHPVPVSSLGFKCPDGFIWNCSYIVYPSKMKGLSRDNCLRYYYLCRALVLGLVLIAWTYIVQAPSVGPQTSVYSPPSSARRSSTYREVNELDNNCHIPQDVMSMLWRN